jgi:hypothetical protein
MYTSAFRFAALLCERLQQSLSITQTVCAQIYSGLPPCTAVAYADCECFDVIYLHALCIDFRLTIKLSFQREASQQQL